MARSSFQSPAQSRIAVPPQQGFAIAPVAIAKRAYEKFLRRGGTHGHDVNDWLDAERELQNETRRN